MSPKLYGSHASPFVRRIRVELKDRDYDFHLINILDEEDRKIVQKLSPHLRVPIWTEDWKIFWDSLIIAEHLQGGPIPTDEKLELNLINEMTDSAIQLFQMKKFNVDQKTESLFSLMQIERIQQILLHFNEKIDDLKPRAKEWLWISLDWFDFRDVFDWRENHPALVRFFQEYPKSKWLEITDPRK